MLKNLTGFQCADACKCICALALKWVQVPLPCIYDIGGRCLSYFRNRRDRSGVSEYSKVKYDVFMTVMAIKQQ